MQVAEKLHSRCRSLAEVHMTLLGVSGGCCFTLLLLAVPVLNG